MAVNDVFGFRSLKMIACFSLDSRVSPSRGLHRISSGGALLPSSPSISVSVAPWLLSTSIQSPPNSETIENIRETVGSGGKQIQVFGLKTVDSSVA